MTGSARFWLNPNLDLCKHKYKYKYNNCCMSPPTISDYYLSSQVSSTDDREQGTRLWLKPVVKAATA